MLKVFKNILFLFLVGLFSFNLALATDDISEMEDFAIKSTEVLNFKQIYVIFNSNLYDGDDADRSFSFKNKNDFLDELYVESAQLDKNDHKKLLLTFDSEAQANGEYELLVINLLDEYGRNIEDGVNSFVTIKMPNEIIEKDSDNVYNNNDDGIITDDLNNNETSSNTNNNLIEDDIELNSATDGNNIYENNIDLNSGSDVTEDFIVNNVIGESKNIEALPKTGPANLFILILATILAALIFVFRFKKSGN